MREMGCREQLRAPTVLGFRLTSVPQQGVSRLEVAAQPLGDRREHFVRSQVSDDTAHPIAAHSA
jgi:hypothetical protein